MRGLRATRVKVIEGLERGLTLEAAARAAGVTRQAVSLWIKRGDEEIAEIVARAQEARLTKRKAVHRAMMQAGVGEVKEIARVRSVGIAVLEEIANNTKLAARDRAVAAKALVDAAERWATRLASGPDQAPRGQVVVAVDARGLPQVATDGPPLLDASVVAGPAGPPSDPEPTAEEAAARWREGA